MAVSDGVKDTPDAPGKGEIHQRVAGPTKEMEDAVYAALDAIDGYADVVRSLLAEQEASDEPNTMLVKRFKQFLKKAESMTTTIEDEVVMDLLFCTDRLFAVDLADKGEFI